MVRVPTTPSPRKEPLHLGVDLFPGTGLVAKVVALEIGLGHGGGPVFFR